MRKKNNKKKTKSKKEKMTRHLPLLVVDRSRKSETAGRNYLQCPHHRHLVDQMSKE